MSAPKSTATVRRELRETRERASVLDLRRQKQVANQVAIIDRLLGEDATYDTVFQETVEKLSATQVELDAVRQELEELKRGRPVE